MQAHTLFTRLHETVAPLGHVLDAGHSGTVVVVVVVVVCVWECPSHEGVHCEHVPAEQEFEQEETKPSGHVAFDGLQITVAHGSVGGCVWVSCANEIDVNNKIDAAITNRIAGICNALVMIKLCLCAVYKVCVIFL